MVKDTYVKGYSYVRNGKKIIVKPHKRSKPFPKMSAKDFPKFDEYGGRTWKLDGLYNKGDTMLKWRKYDLKDSGDPYRSIHYKEGKKEKIALYYTEY